MAQADIVLTVEQEPEISLTVTEAKLKPEQSKTVTPSYDAQIVLPDAGMTLGSVTVEPIPDPTERLAISENGSYDVTRIGTADVDVLPYLQTRTVEPKEYGQTIRADSAYDGLEQVNVSRIPEWYVIPQGSVEVTENGSYDVTEKKTVNVAVPVPVMPDEYAVGGSLVNRTLTGYHIADGTEEIFNTLNNQKYLIEIYIPDSVKYIRQQAFAQNAKMQLTDLPASLEVIEDYAFFACAAITSLTFHSTPTSITSHAFASMANLRNIYVPWSEGAVANAPWGATNATIHYNWEE